MDNLLEGAVPYKKDDVAKYIENGWWPGLTLGDLIDRAAECYPEKEAVVDENRRLTFKEIKEKSERLAAGLFRIGIRPLDRIMIQLPNWHEFAFAYFACQKIGAITVLLIDRYRQLEIGHIAKLTGASSWIVPAQYRKTDYIPIIDDILKEIPEITRVITVRDSSDSSPGRDGFHTLERLIEENPVTEEVKVLLKELRPDPMQVAHMGPTGGTTGIPKIVPRIHNSLLCGVENCSLSWDQHEEDINLLAGPIGHDLSFTKGFLGSVITRGKVIFLDRTDNESICKAIDREKVTAIVWVPALAKRLLQYEDLEKFDLGSLRKMHSAGGASHPEMVKEVMERLRMKFHNGYGGTEGMTCITRPDDDYNTICCTVGRPTFPNDTYKVVDPDGKALPPETQGELLVKGPCVFSGYYNNPEENREVFTDDGFFRTGDIAKISTEGYITLTGRIKEMINRGGESISATVIEGLIQQHPGVAAVAVIPMPDPFLGEKVCAYIQPMAGAELSFESIIVFLKSQKASVLELPERIEFVTELPYTRAHKLNKKLLREDIILKLSAESDSAAT